MDTRTNTASAESWPEPAASARSHSQELELVEPASVPAATSEPGPLRAEEDQPAQYEQPQSRPPLSVPSGYLFIP